MNDPFAIGTRRPGAAHGTPRASTRAPLLLFLMAVPLFALDLYNELQNRASREADLSDEARRWLVNFEIEQEQVFGEAAWMLDSLIATGVVAMPSAHCAGVMERLAARSPPYFIATITDADGVVRCATVPDAVGHSIADRPTFQRARETDGTVQGTSAASRYSGKPMVPLVKRYTTGTGGFGGVATVLIDTGWLEESLEKKRPPPHLSLLIADRAGTVFARTPATGEAPGPLPDALRPYLKAPHAGLAEIRDNGQDLLVAYSPLDEGVKSTFTATILDREARMAEVDRAILRSLLISAAVLLAAAAATAWALRRYLRYREAAEAALHDSEAFGRDVLERMAEGFVVLDRAFRVTRINAEGLAIDGRPAEAILGRTNWEAWPDSVGTAIEAAYRQVMAERSPAMFEHYYPSVRRGPWFEIRVYPAGEGIAVFFRDITERKEAARRQDYRFELNERLRDLADPQAMMDAATAMLGDFLTVAQVGYGEIDETQTHVIVHRDWNDGRIPSVVGTWRMDDFGPAFIADMKRGETVAIPDVRQDPRTSAPEVIAAYDGIRTRSILDVPLVKDGRMVAMLFIHHPEPRPWSAAEVAIVEDTCERLWAAVEHARAEARLRDSEARYRALFEQSAVGMAHVSSNDCWTAVNQTLCRMLGYSEAELLGTAFLDLTHPDDREEDRRMVQAVDAGELPVFRREKRYLHKDGSVVWMDVLAAPLRNACGQVTHRVVVFQDITARQMAKAALLTAKEEAERAVVMQRAQLQELESIYAAAPVGLWLGDRECRFIRVNTVMAEINGLPVEAHIGRTVEDLVPGVYDVIKPHYDQVLATGRPVEFEVTGTTARQPDAIREWVVAYYPLTDESGEVYAVSSVVREVTEQRRAEKALSAAKEEAEKAAQAKSRFLAAASHDLRQPMQSLLLFTSALHRHVGPAGHEALAHLERSLEALRGLLDSLLDVSKLDAGLVQPTIEDFPLKAVLDELGASYRPIAESRGLTWSIADCGETVRSDRVLLGRLLRNLIENAVRYTREGSITVRCVPEQDRIRVEVADTGVGIQPEDRERIFEEFVQAHNVERNRQQGLGLGLAIVRRIADLLGYRIELRSEPGQGTSFAFSLPRVGTERACTPVSASPQEPVATTGQNRLVLVIDDEVLILLGLQSMLKDWGHTVIVATSAEQAVERLRTAGRCPDFILADYRLAQGHLGTDAVTRIREFCGREIPGVLLTGETGTESLRQAAGHDLRILHKPITARQLAEVVNAPLPEQEQQTA